ncbi:MAG: hypothetical protein ACRYGR_00815, partial [Janthinobacterium lividum]
FTQNIKDKSLRQSAIDGATDQIRTALESKYITYLDLSRLSITGNHLDKLFANLCQNTTLKRLNLSSKNQRFKTLRNRITFSNTSALLKELVLHNTTLRRLDLGRNLLTYEESKQLEQEYKDLTQSQKIKSSLSIIFEPTFKPTDEQRKLLSLSEKKRIYTAENPRKKASKKARIVNSTQVLEQQPPSEIVHNYNRFAQTPLQQLPFYQNPHNINYHPNLPVRSLPSENPYLVFYEIDNTPLGQNPMIPNINPYENMNSMSFNDEAFDNFEINKVFGEKSEKQYD